MRADTIRDNPLFDDPVLFGMYMDALNVGLRRPEIREACDEFTISPATLRMRMSGNAARVLGSAPREFEAYRRAVAQELTAASTSPAQVTHGSAWDPRDAMRAMVKGGFIGGAVMTASGAASSVWWAPMATLAQAGATVLLVAGVLWAAPRFFGGDLYFRSLGLHTERRDRSRHHQDPADGRGQRNRNPRASPHAHQ